MTTTSRGRPRSFDRDAALDKAIRLFWRQGYEATSIRDLTDELGIGAPSLYNTFGDKHALFDEAVRVYDAAYGGFIDAALDEERTARDAAARILAEAPSRYTRDGLPSGCLIVSGDIGTSDAAVQETLRNLRQAKVVQFTAKIQSDVDTGRLPADTDPEALARYTFAMLSGLAQSACENIPRTKLEQMAKLAFSAWA